MHDYYQADGEAVALQGPRATVTLYDWAVPCRLPDSGLTVGDPRDMPVPVATRVASLRVGEGGAAIHELTLELTYADAKRTLCRQRVQPVAHVGRIRDRISSRCGADNRLLCGGKIGGNRCHSATDADARNRAVPATTATAVASNHWATAVERLAAHG
ncbi:MAG: hypothetical protein R2932_42600 [Caldilineaceae bacterium]